MQVVLSLGSHKAVLTAQTSHWEWPRSENTGTWTHPEVYLGVKWSMTSLGPLALKTQVSTHQHPESIQLICPGSTLVLTQLRHSPGTNKHSLKIGKYTGRGMVCHSHMSVNYYLNYI